MKAEIITICNRKGGTAKTATAHALGAGLMKKGRKVLFVDVDSQANLTYSTGADMNSPGSMELLAGSITTKEAIQKTPQGDIIAGSPGLSAADMTLTDTGKEYKLTEALEDVKNKYDFIVIDTPAALNILTVNALTASNSIIITALADAYSLQGIDQVLKCADTVKKYCNPSLKVKGILITRYNGRAILSKTILQDLQATADSLQTHLYRDPIRECIAVKEAAAVRQNIFDYAPNSNAAQDYNHFIKEFLKGR